jgi:hypothetical protein
LVTVFGWKPSEIMAEDEYWINRVLLDLDAKARARQKPN